MTEDTRHGRPHRDLDARDLKALAHPIRVEMYDLLSQYGPQTASMLAERVGESSGVTSYHLRTLAKHGLIEEDPERGNARERWWRRPAGSVSMGGPTAMATPAGRAASEIVLGEFYRLRHEQLLQYVRAELLVADENTEPKALLSTTTLNLTEAQFSELSDRVEALIGEFYELARDQEGDDVHRYSVRTDIFPLRELGASASKQHTHEGDER